MKNIRISTALHTRLKVEAAKQDTTIREIVEEVVRDWYGELLELEKEEARIDHIGDNPDEENAPEEER